MAGPISVAKKRDKTKWSPRPDYSGRHLAGHHPGATRRGRGEGRVRGGGHLSPPRFMTSRAFGAGRISVAGKPFRELALVGCGAPCKQPRQLP